MTDGGIYAIDGVELYGSGREVDPAESVDAVPLLASTEDGLQDEIDNGD